MKTNTIHCTETTQHALDVGKADEIAAYISRRNKKHPTHHATLNRVCQRFRMNQIEVRRVIDSVEFLWLSDMAYLPSQSELWGEQMVAAWCPQIAPDAPIGQKLVLVIR